jgi:hypothetical protein
MSDPVDDGSEDADGEWQFSLDELPDSGSEHSDTTDGAERSQEGSVAGGFAPSDVVEPGTVNPENAFFVLVGVLLAGLFVGGFIAAVL